MSDYLTTSTLHAPTPQAGRWKIGFDESLQADIRNVAAEKHMTVSGFIRSCVVNGLIMHRGGTNTIHKSATGDPHGNV